MPILYSYLLISTRKKVQKRVLDLRYHGLCCVSFRQLSDRFARNCRNRKWLEESLFSALWGSGSFPASLSEARWNWSAWINFQVFWKSLKKNWREPILLIQSSYISQKLIFRKIPVSEILIFWTTFFAHLFHYFDLSSMFLKLKLSLFKNTFKYFYSILILFYENHFQLCHFNFEKFSSFWIITMILKLVIIILFSRFLLPESIFGIILKITLKVDKRKEGRWIQNSIFLTSSREVSKCTYVFW